jgi:hypothetical protein
VHPVDVDPERARFARRREGFLDRGDFALVVPRGVVEDPGDRDRGLGGVRWFGRGDQRAGGQTGLLGDAALALPVHALQISRMPKNPKPADG